MKGLVCDFCGSTDLRPLNEAERQALPEAFSADTIFCNACGTTEEAATPKEPS